MKTVTITSQGQITIPASMRRSLGLKKGDQIDVRLNAETRSVSLRKPMSLEEVTEYAMRHIDPKAKPVTNVDEYYQKYRGETIR